ncbi:MAG: tRNA (adenosine(37)-N6)-threonylcarbamoyltransferase complex ATPase subunit type 1 TsaE [Anaerovoracaceae bacterium]
MITNNLKETEEFGIQLGKNAEPGHVIALIGDLGTGKTELTKGIAKGLGVTENITSPTFTIIKEYEGRLPLYHFDIYRLGEEGLMDAAITALEDLGYEEYFYGQGVCVVEWADKALKLLPASAKIIKIEYGENENQRQYTTE